ncbi:MAG TPA: RDD family protein [Candidatus Brocadiia bacterium]|nr:RDD family protein [Candidatus Brocadiia bacterium]
MKNVSNAASAGPDILTIDTPESVRLEFEAAGLGNRTLAWLIDLAIKYGILIPLIFGLEALNVGLLSRLPGLSTGGSVLVSLGVFIYQWFYFVLFEYFWFGQTPGKRLMRLRVLQSDGRSPGFWPSVIRNLTRYPDLLGIGPCLMMFTPSCRRLGDFAAGTVVVREHVGGLSEVMPEIESDAMQTPQMPTVRLDPAEFEAVAQFLKRRDTLDEGARLRIAGEMAEALRNRMIARGFMPPDAADDEAFIQALIPAMPPDRPPGRNRSNQK